jgi:hypothetical protein
MSEVQDIENEPETEVIGGAQAEAGSVISRLQHLRKEHTEATTKKLELPGYRGELLAEYVPLEWEVVRQLAMRGERGKRNPQIAPIVAADGLANAVQGFYYRNPETGEESPVTLEGEPIERFDRRLAKALGIEVTKETTTREIVRAVFPDDLALVAHYGAFSEWQAERTDDDESEVIARAKGDDAVYPTSS